MNKIYEETKFLMKKYGIIANKKLGQNFLIDDNVIETIVDSSKISKDDLVIEIGPGLGSLTRKIIRKSRESYRDWTRWKNDKHFRR